MSETTTEDPEEQTDEMMAFEVSVSRTFEQDFSQSQVNGLMMQTDADTPEEAIAQMMIQRETEGVEPVQKLLGVNVDVDRPSNS